MDKINSVRVKYLKRINWRYYLIEINSQKYLWERIKFWEIIFWFPMFGKTEYKVYPVEENIPPATKQPLLMRNYPKISIPYVALLIPYIIVVNHFGPFIQLPLFIKNNWQLVIIIGYLIYLLYCINCYKRAEINFNFRNYHILVRHPLDKDRKLNRFPRLLKIRLWIVLFLVVFVNFYLFGISFSDLGLFIYMIPFECLLVFSGCSNEVENDKARIWKNTIFEVKEVE